MCDLKASNSSRLTRNAKSSGKRVLSSHCLVKRLCRYAIELRQVGIEYHLFAAKKKDELGCILRLQSELLCHLLTTASLLHLRVGTFAAFGDEAVDPRGDNGQRNRAALEHRVVERAERAASTRVHGLAFKSTALANDVS